MTPTVTDFELYEKIGEDRDAKVTVSDGENTSRFRLRVAASVIGTRDEEALLRWLADLVAPEMLRKEADDTEFGMEIETFEVNEGNLANVLRGNELPAELPR
jgi:hypothetical protein